MNILVQHQPAFVYTGKTNFDVDKLTVLFIHGAANDHQVWLGLMGALDGFGMNTLAVDLPGHGKTFESVKTSITTYADWIINLLDNAGINHAVLVGHSMGSLIALDCAIRYPTRVAKMILIGTAAPMPVAEKILLMAHEQPETAIDMLVRASFYTQKCADGTWPPATSMMQSYRDLLGNSRPGVLANDMNVCNQFSIGPPALKQIKMPTLVMVGAEDKMTSPQAGTAVALSITHAEIVVIPAAGHMMMVESPIAVRTAVARMILETAVDR